MTITDKIKRREDLRITLCGTIGGLCDFLNANRTPEREQIFINHTLDAGAAYREANEALEAEWAAAQKAAGENV